MLKLFCEMSLLLNRMCFWSQCPWPRYPRCCFAVLILDPLVLIFWSWSFGHDFLVLIFWTWSQYSQNQPPEGLTRVGPINAIYMYISQDYCPYLKTLPTQESGVGAGYNLFFHSAYSRNRMLLDNIYIKIKCIRFSYRSIECTDSYLHHRCGNFRDLSQIE